MIFPLEKNFFKFNLRKKKDTVNNMCSIFGIISPGNYEKRGQIIRKMAEDQFHRGPDDGDFYEDETAALGHRRLSIIDLSSAARQPMHSSDERFILVFNGEIYNYRDLKTLLESKGHKFTTSSDTECIIHCFEEYGTKTFSMLDGMFAIALYDSAEKKVFLARDRMGKKPLFYFINNGELIFGSELSALKLYPDMPRKFNMQSVSDYLSLLYIPPPATIYENVFKMRPGEFMIFDCRTHALHREKYFAPDCSGLTDKDFATCSWQLRELVFNAVKKRLMSDVPIGVFLSGGVDSTIVTHIMTRLRAPEQTEAFSIGSDDPLYDESMRARHAANFINKRNGNALIHHEKTVNADDFKLLRKLVKHYGEPYADASMIPTSLVSGFAREKVTVALTGDGADELFGGYDRYFLMSRIHYFNLLPHSVRHILFHTLSQIIPSSSERTRQARIKRAFDVIGCRENQQYYRILDRCRSDFKNNLAGAAFKDSLNTLKQNSIIEMLDNLSSASAVGKYLEFDQQTYLPGDILTKTDIASMANSLELRSPFLDRDVVDFANSLPFEFKICKSDKKHILKHAFKDMLPKSVITGSKKGFGVPVANYLREAWHDEAENILFQSEKLAQSEIFNLDFLHKVWQMHQSGQTDNSYQLWTVILFALFLENES